MADRMKKDYGKWFPAYKAADKSSVRIVCFPYAGAGATVYMDWFRFLPDDVELFPVAYPMREKRRKEDMPNDLKILGRQIAAENEMVFREKEVILFGHCEGSVIAYETAAALKELYGILPKLYVASGSNPPCVPLSISIDENMDMDEAAKKFVELHFIPEAFKNNKVYLKAFVPVLFRDFILFQNYCDRDIRRLDSPILVVHGNNDEMINEEHIGDWKKYTSAGVKYAEYPGEHFYITSTILPKLIDRMIRESSDLNEA